MIPLILKIKIPNKNGNEFKLYLPLFIGWLILLPILLLLLPLILVISVLAWNTVYGRLILYFYPILLSLLWNLQGLKIDIKDKNNQIFLSFI